MLLYREIAIKLLKHHLKKSQDRMRTQANKHPTKRVFDIGDTVYLKLQPYCQNSLVVREVPKLAAKFFGPYKIMDKVGKCTYKLDLLDSSRIHHVFHVSQLKKAIHSDQAIVTLPPSTLLIALLHPRAILD